MARFSFAFSLLLFVGVSVAVQAAEPRTIGEIERLDPAFDKLVAAGVIGESL